MRAARIRRASEDELRQRQGELAALEEQFVYPLGEDSFRIDHGADYLAFFHSLGEPIVFVAEEGERLAGVLVAVRRSMPDPVWYLCDLKVDPGDGGRLLALRLYRAFDRSARDGLARFGVSMNPSTGKNRLVRLALRLGLGGELGPELSFLSLDHPTWQEHGEAIQAATGPIRFLDTRASKAIVLESTGRPMPLLHGCRDERTGSGLAREGFTHMLCLAEGDPALGVVEELGLTPQASASVLYQGDLRIDWRFFSSAEV